MADNDRTVPFEVTAICDNCGAVGAYDVLGDCFCASCLKAAETRWYDNTYAGQRRKFAIAVNDLREAIIATGLGKAMFAIMDFLARLIAAWERVSGKHNV